MLILSAMGVRTACIVFEPPALLQHPSSRLLFCCVMCCSKQDNDRTAVPYFSFHLQYGFWTLQVCSRCRCRVGTSRLYGPCPRVQKILQSDTNSAARFVPSNSAALPVFDIDPTGGSSKACSIVGQRECQEQRLMMLPFVRDTLLLLTTQWIGHSRFVVR